MTIECCSRPMLSAKVDNRDGWYCSVCQRTVEKHAFSAATTVEKHAFSVPESNKHAFLAREAISEDDYQAEIVKHLQRTGEVLVTSRRRKAARDERGAIIRDANGKPAIATGGDGVSKGLPDLLYQPFGISAWWIGIEVKGPKTAVSDEQERLHAQGSIIITRAAGTIAESLQLLDRQIEAAKKVLKIF